MKDVGIHDIDTHTLAGEHLPLRRYEGTVVLIVNVASRCGLTTQYEGLQLLQETYADRGFSVIGIPCNQFANEEPGSAAEIVDFCTSVYGVTFPLLEKTQVNGRRRHALYQELVKAADADGMAGDVEWNFEKFLVDGTGSVLHRFRPRIAPTDAVVIEAIERELSTSEPSTTRGSRG